MLYSPKDGSFKSQDQVDSEATTDGKKWVMISFLIVLASIACLFIIFGVSKLAGA